MYRHAQALVLEVGCTQDHCSTATVYKCCSLGGVPPYWVSSYDRLYIMVLISSHWICLDGILPRCMSCIILRTTTAKVSQYFLLAATPGSATGKQLTVVVPFSFHRDNTWCAVDAQSFKMLASRELGLTGWNGTPASCTGVGIEAGTRSTQFDFVTVKRSACCERRETRDKDKSGLPRMCHQPLTHVGPSFSHSHRPSLE